MAMTFLQRKPDSGLGNIRSSPSAPSRNIDWVLLLGQSALSVIGLAVIYSASYSKFSDPFLFVTRQEVFLIGAVVAMVVVMSFDYDWWKDRSRFLYGVTIMLLVLVILVGAVSGGASLNFDVGPLRLQPAEFAKFTVLLTVAAYLGDDRSDVLPYHRFIIGLLLVGAPASLIIIQPDLGSASVLITMAMGIMLVAGAKTRYMFLITAVSIGTVGAAVATGLVNDYQLLRFTAFFDQDSNDPKLRDVIYQGRNAIRALATGGIDGKGWLQGPITNAKNDIPVQWADFPFSAIGEQFGLIGCAVVIGLYVLVLVRIWRIAHLSRDLLGTYLCVGVFSMLLWQVFQNVAMTVGLMPITGLPLPFISYGGSGLVTFFALMGLVQNVHMRRYR
ncbi:MAG: rod shape-determining protein RodA [Acidimicrobiaceae bacterium]|jgi:rod shape determining protein RodA|nr:rod shape-determining protein RodA [Acidimicrobiaceae bacterium]HQY15968.1 FtsW/RodA/SpoVE family cell cycle protein [Ilumatobacteraceae bacterium]HQY84103.1 FtsW/RodA/SpoVE family cell cycle protein [Ilumatobacteraceae bacterium]HRA84847.1 FtsW/RodA/SpoVE family cell cycle protein [Ilumatobacteraceae bacterium]HRC47033.1 FtsW/RodA/SpoVE family cell cycle protein [Ilumatobacteraceae bacterium]